MLKSKIKSVLDACYIVFMILAFIVAASLTKTSIDMSGEDY